MDDVQIVDYDPRWPLLFDEEAKRLRAVLDPSLDAAFHNGLLFRRQLRYVIRYNAARPWLRPCCMRIYVSGRIRGLQ